MTLTERGRIEEGAIILSRPLGLPDGTEVVVQIEAVENGMGGVVVTDDPRSLPFFGMWADRADMNDPEGWLQREGNLWQQRATRPD